MRRPFHPTGESIMSRLILPFLLALALAYLAQSAAPVFHVLSAALTLHPAEDSAGRPVNQR
jgi:hypothetical protein